MEGLIKNIRKILNANDLINIDISQFDGPETVQISGNINDDKIIIKCRDDINGTVFSIIINDKIVGSNGYEYGTDKEIICKELEIALDWIID